MTAKEMELMAQLTEIADKEFDGHFTVMRFGSNWRVGFGTPWTNYSEEKDAAEMAVGKTFAEAAEAALAAPQHADCITNCHENWKKWDRELADYIAKHNGDAHG